MPEYAHKCKACGHEFSVKKPLSEAGTAEACPSCGGETRRVWTPLSVRGGSGGGSSFSSGGC